jgi:hypothetical protein
MIKLLVERTIIPPIILKNPLVSVNPFHVPYILRGALLITKKKTIREAITSSINPNILII